ncbi:hypothetical protein ACP6PL_14445 [Dapis sp. BLCC M126]|uniref:hypothetical protein n=1 Tax=Dapis sp. BLCC M126 TaxID=3400189 RepID=UPI003CF2FFB0
MSAVKVTPTEAQINQCQDNINKFINSIRNNPDQRAGAWPYNKFHKPGEPIYGTVMMFHGFSSRPDQMWRLCDYLFNNGFNVYQAGLAGHPFIHAEVNWPNISMKPEYRQPIVDTINQDPILRDIFQSLGQDNKSGEQKAPTLAQELKLVERIVELNPIRLAEMIEALTHPKDKQFNDFFDSSHAHYLDYARQRFQEIEPMPGDIYTVGLSVGGATAISLAEEYPERVKKIVAYAPLLKNIETKGQEWQVDLIGSLNMLPPTNWNHMSFPVSCYSAINRFGDLVRSQENLEKIKNISTFLVLTDNDDAADIETNQHFFQEIGGETGGNRYFEYNKADLVPHPMIDPTEESQHLKNHFWKTLYQETYRFLTTGDVITNNMHKMEQDQNLPLVAPL